MLGEWTWSAKERRELDERNEQFERNERISPLRFWHALA